MARRPKRSNKSTQNSGVAVAGPAGPSKQERISTKDSEVNSDVETTPQQKSKRMIIAGGVALAWLLTLSLLALLTSNPVTLNREQIQRADFVISAEVLDEQSGRVSPLREWKRNEKFDELTLANLPKTDCREAERYIIPISLGDDGHFQVTPSKLPGKLPVVYPANDEAIRQLENLLNGEQ